MFWGVRADEGEGRWQSGGGEMHGGTEVAGRKKGEVVSQQHRAEQAGNLNVGRELFKTCSPLYLPTEGVSVG